MKTPVCSPNIESLTRRWPRRGRGTGRRRRAARTPRSSRPGRTVGRRSGSSAGRTCRRPGRPPGAVPPIATASSTQRWVRPAAVASTIGPTSVVGSSGSPTLSAAAPATNLLEERVPDVLVDERPLDADADLARVREAADEAALDRPVEVGGLVDDDAGVAAELEDDLLLAGPVLHPPADRRRPGEGQQLEARVRDHPVAELAGHRQDRTRSPPARRRLRRSRPRSAS